MTPTIIASHQLDAEELLPLLPLEGQHWELLMRVRSDGHRETRLVRVDSQGRHIRPAQA